MSVSSNYDYYYDEFDDCEISIFSAIGMLLIFLFILGFEKIMDLLHSVARWSPFSNSNQSENNPAIL